MILLVLIIIIGVAYLTLLERKILGYIQNRKGPNKVGFVGILQPFRDAIKLIRKEVFFIFKSNYNLYYISPVIIFIIIIIIWILYPFITNVYFLNYSFLLMIIFISVIRYIVVYLGWSANSVYSIIGSIRSVSQILSYEVRFILIILILIILRERYSFLDFVYFQYYMWYIIYLYPIFIIFFIRILAELNRSPIDFIEGESELVSGFNVEYFRGNFTLIFLREYGIILYFSIIKILIFTNLLIKSYVYLIIWINLICLLIIIIRGMLPRIRYDELIYLCWKIILPLVLIYIIIILGLKFFFIIII